VPRAIAARDIAAFRGRDRFVSCRRSQMQQSTFFRAADAISETLILQAQNAIPSNAANRRCSGRRHRAIDSRFDFADRRQAYLDAMRTDEHV
jgi:hypothetical protein